MLWNKNISKHHPNQLYAVELLFIAFVFQSGANQAFQIVRIFNVDPLDWILALLSPNLKSNDPTLRIKVEWFIWQFWHFTRSFGAMFEVFVYWLINFDLYLVVRNPFKPESKRLIGYKLTALAYFLVLVALNTIFP